MKKRIDVAKLTKLRRADVIATREYQLVTRVGSKRKVVARFGRPRPFPQSDGLESYCIFQIDGLEEPIRPELAPGVDGVQALFIAMQMAWTLLITSEAYKEGRLSFWGIPDLGLPPIYPRFVASEPAKTRRSPPKPRSRARAARTPPRAGKRPRR